MLYVYTHSQLSYLAYPHTPTLDVGVCGLGLFEYADFERALEATTCPELAPALAMSVAIRSARLALAHRGLVSVVVLVVGRT